MRLFSFWSFCIRRSLVRFDRRFFHRWFSIHLFFPLNLVCIHNRYINQFVANCCAHHLGIFHCALGNGYIIKRGFFYIAIDDISVIHCKPDFCHLADRTYQHNRAATGQSITTIFISTTRRRIHIRCHSDFPITKPVLINCFSNRENGFCAIDLFGRFISDHQDFFIFHERFSFTFHGLFRLFNGFFVVGFCVCFNFARCGFIEKILINDWSFDHSVFLSKSNRQHTHKEQAECQEQAQNSFCFCDFHFFTPFVFLLLRQSNDHHHCRNYGRR